jgi:sulfur carrier protein
MVIMLNGERRDLPAGATVATVIELLCTQAPEGRGVAVAVGDEVVPRGAWSVTELSEGARVEVVAAVQGG